MLGERLARGTLAGESCNARGPGDRNFGREFILGRRGFELLELQFQLVEQALSALGALAVQRPA